MIAANPKDICVLPRLWGRTLGEVVYEAQNDSGGHFYSIENPEGLAKDLRIVFGTGGGAFKILNDKSGYD